MERYADSFSISPPVTSFPVNKGGVRSGAPEHELIPIYSPNRPDTVVQRTLHPAGALAPGTMPEPILTFAGLSLVNGGGGIPPDTNGEIGPNHYVQTINQSFAVYNRSGTLLTGPTALNSLWSNSTGPCHDQNSGDPVVLYDQLAHRWLISQFTEAPAPYFECIAISQTADPTGTYFAYAFQVNATNFEDYPKLGVWPDGYYASFVELMEPRTTVPARTCLSAPVC